MWLGFIAKSTYQQGIGHLMTDKPNVFVPMLFYAVFAVGLVVFAVAKNIKSQTPCPNFCPRCSNLVEGLACSVA